MDQLQWQPGSKTPFLRGVMVEDNKSKLEIIVKVTLAFTMQESIKHAKHHGYNNSKDTLK